MRKELRIAVSLIFGIAESGLAIVIWFGQHLQNWDATPVYLRFAAPVPYFAGQPETATDFWGAWVANSVFWGLLLFGALSLLHFVRRRNVNKSAVA